MSLYERLDQALREAIKNQQPVATSTLRMLKSAIRYREVEVKRPLTEAELLAVINTPGQAASGRHRRVHQGRQTGSG